MFNEYIAYTASVLQACVNPETNEIDIEMLLDNLESMFNDITESDMVEVLNHFSL